MNRNEFLKWLPSDIREAHLNILQGFTAVKFPAAYFARVPKAMSVKWVLLSPVDMEGMVVKTAPDFLVNGLIKTMEKYEQKFETVVL